MSHPDDRVGATDHMNRSNTMSNAHSNRAALDVRRGSRWSKPPVHPSIHVEQQNSALPSAGEWVERYPNNYARAKSAIPVTVGWESFRIL